jgi:hypothetical protein
MVKDEFAEGVGRPHSSVVIRFVDAAFRKFAADAVVRRTLLKRLRAVRSLLAFHQLSPS